VRWKAILVLVILERGSAILWRNDNEDRSA